MTVGQYPRSLATRGDYSPGMRNIRKYEVSAKQDENLQRESRLGMLFGDGKTAQVEGAGEKRLLQEHLY